jgi:diacylglycerol kinase
MHEHKHSPDRGWAEKFHDAFRGLKVGVRGQSSFLVHFSFAAAVVVAGLLLRINLSEWCILLLCIVGVLAAEMLNTALQSLARSITDQMDPHVGSALDIGSAAVLVAAIGATVVGTMVLLNRLGARLTWW